MAWCKDQCSGLGRQSSADEGTVGDGLLSITSVDGRLLTVDFFFLVAWHFQHCLHVGQIVNKKAESFYCNRCSTGFSDRTLSRFCEWLSETHYPRPAAY